MGPNNQIMNKTCFDGTPTEQQFKCTPHLRSIIYTYIYARYLYMITIQSSWLFQVALLDVVILLFFSRSRICNVWHLIDLLKHEHIWFIVTNSIWSTANNKNNRWTTNRLHIVFNIWSKRRHFGRQRKNELWSDKRSET